MRRLTSLILVALAALSLAAEATTVDCTRGRRESCPNSVLEEIVVTGRRAPELLMDSPSSVSVVSEQQLARDISYGLADALRGVPGVQVSDAGQPGLKRIRIRGEESRRTAILVDGQEITDHWEVGTPLSMHPSMVERIELVRGSGSVLYGARALSGVVNFITRKGGTKPVQLDLSTSLDSATRGHDWFASVFGDIQGFEYRVAATDGDHDDRDTPQGKQENTGFDNRGRYAYLGRRFGAQRLELSYHNYESATEVFVEESVKTTFPLIDFTIDVPQRDRETLALFYEWSDVSGYLPVLRANLHRQWNDRSFDTYSATLVPGPRPSRTDRWIYSDADLEVTDGVLQLDWRPAADHYLVSGLQLTREAVDQERHVDTLVNGVEAPAEDIHEEATIDTAALFALDEWRLDHRTTLRLGARHYWVEGNLDDTSRAGLRPFSENDSELVASLGLVHALSDDLALRANAAQGYVYPSLLQFATGAYAGSRYVNPNPGLEPEHSYSVEAGARLRAAGWAFDLGIFYTSSEDYIDHVFCTPADDCLSPRDKRYVNIGESEAQGLELYVAREARPRALRPYINLTWMNRSNRYESFVTNDSGTPELSGSLGLIVEGAVWGKRSGWVDACLRGETASKREEAASSGRPLVDSDDSWITLNVSAGLALDDAERFNLVVELENLADATYSTSAENLLAPGRSISAKVDLRL